MDYIKAIYLNEFDKKLRKQWLIIAVISFGYPVLFSAFSLATENLLSFLSVFSGLFIFFCIWYQSAYRKYGTAVLAISLSFAPFHIYSIVPKILAESVYSIAFWEQMLGFFIDLWWYLVCFRLRTLNLKLQMKMLPSSDPYISAIRQAVNLKDLHSKYLEAIREVPHYGDRFSEEYEAKRASLSKSHFKQ